MMAVPLPRRETLPEDWLARHLRACNRPSSDSLSRLCCPTEVKSMKQCPATDGRMSALTILLQADALCKLPSSNYEQRRIDPLPFRAATACLRARLGSRTIEKPCPLSASPATIHHPPSTTHHSPITIRLSENNLVVKRLVLRAINAEGAVLDGQGLVSAPAVVVEDIHSGDLAASDGE